MLDLIDSECEIFTGVAGINEAYNSLKMHPRQIQIACVVPVLPLGSLV